MNNKHKWKTISEEYEGLPLFLRLPLDLKYDELKKTYPLQIVVTHFLDKLNDNGIPETDYNNSLFNFDDQLVNTLKKANAGLTVLVETFNGNRAYYMYAKEDFPPSLLENSLKQSFPQHHLEVESKLDSDWMFIKNYANDWGF